MTAVDVDLEKTPKLFAVALFATHEETRPELAAWAIFAASHDEAYKRGMAQAMELWPEAKGWWGHSVRVAEIVLRHDNASAVADPIPERIM